MNNRTNTWALTIFGLFALFQAAAQSDSLKTLELKPVFVVESKPTFATTSRNITAITNTEMKESGAQTLSDALATLPGVSQLTTGAISKPVIRGMYGNRLQVNMGGQRLEDQQWEDEHGLGLSDVGVERVELVKGPAALLFGSEAMGGVVNIVEENFAEPGKAKQNLNLKLFSNTYGAGLDYGLKKSAGNHGFLLRAGMESHADYSDGEGERVPNTRFAMYNLKSGYLVHKNNWTSENRLLASFNEFGFIKDTTELHEEEEEESIFERAFEGEHHSVLLAMLSSKNTLQLSDSKTLQFTVGLQSNHRQELEGEEGEEEEEGELDLWLQTATLNASLQKQLRNGWSWTGGLAGLLQDNKNEGGRIIVPDATTAEGGVYNYFKKQVRTDRLEGDFEAGIRYDRRHIKTFETEELNPPAGEVSPFSKSFDELNGSVGQSLIFRNLVLKADIGTGYRTGNLAELSANGQHEGTQKWYVGDPDLKVEQCLNMDVSANWHHGGFSLHGSVFRNRFLNYIYLNPTNEVIEGFPVFRYSQTDATLKGFEVGTGFEKERVCELSLDYSLLDARRDDDSWLPFIPANRLLMNGKFFLPLRKENGPLPFVSLGAAFAEEQDHPSVNETSTPSYWLFHAGAGVTLGHLRLLLTCRNLTNKVYNDHLSQLKYLGVKDQGINVVLNLGWQF